MPLEQDLKLIHARGIYDSDKKKMREEDGLLISGDKIDRIGDFSLLRQKTPKAKVIELKDCWLLPGLINTHVHLECDPTSPFQAAFEKNGPNIRFARAVIAANTLLRSGVTTVRDAGSGWELLDLLRPDAAGIVQLPRLILSGPPLTVTGGHLYFMGGEADTTDELIRSVREHQKRGCGAIKIMVTGGQMTASSMAERVSYTLDQVRAAVQEADRLGLPTFCHCLTKEGFALSAEAGVGSIEHCACFVRSDGMLARRFDRPFMERFRGKKQFFSNTLASLWHDLDGWRHANAPGNARMRFLVAQEQQMLDLFREHIALGLTPVLSTDAGVPHTWFDDTALELEIMVKRCGLTPAEAIAIATTNSAACLGLQESVGKLLPGYCADIVALGSDPLEDIGAWRQVKQVFCAGGIVDAPHTREASDLFY